MGEPGWMHLLAAFNVLLTNSHFISLDFQPQNPGERLAKCIQIEASEREKLLPATPLLSVIATTLQGCVCLP